MMMGSEDYESIADELRKDEKKLAVSVKTLKFMFCDRISSRNKRKFSLWLSIYYLISQKIFKSKEK